MISGFLAAVRRRAPSAWRKFRWLAWRAAAVLGAFLFLILVTVALAGWYTSRPQFCNSCHIMEPYYRSWQTSAHKKVSCIECHFEPGFGGEVRGKMAGLVQLAKYVTQTQGPRPIAEVPDASCLRSGCHETRLLSGRVPGDFHGIPFDHTPHLGESRRGKRLRCTSCHGQIVQGAHIAVTTSTCFLCHFKDQPFNQELGACTRCHQIPEKSYDLGGGVKFTHELAYQKGVDCANCHGDLVRGNGEVPRERCMVCHNRESDLKRIKEHDFIHQKHVTEHAVNCLNCHLTIEHSEDKRKIVHAAADCASCHPNHHQEQVRMFESSGAALLSLTGGGVNGERTPGMLGTRIGCKTCHRFKEVSSTGSVLWRASAQVCSTCHDAAGVEKLWHYHESLRASLPELKAGLKEARAALAAAKLPADRPVKLASELDRLERNLDFIRKANDIHNIHYASMVLHQLEDDLDKVCRELKAPPPKVQFPAPPTEFK
jgi:nitrate/TMAO reductase-like tetraheme cytochrome c subunit